MLFYVLPFLLALAAICTSASTERVCNNSPELCSTPYGQVTHLGAHNSPFLRDASTAFSSFGNQFFNSTVQLDAGVRLLSGQIHVFSNPVTKARELHVCHSSCAFMNAGPLHQWLWDVRTWMDAHSDEVITLILVNYHSVPALEFEAEYSKADLAHYGYVPLEINKAPAPSTVFKQTWPTLEQMIDNGGRLVSSVNAIVPDRDNAPYLLNQFDFVWENAYDVTSPNGFSCTPNRPSNTTSIDEERNSGKLFLMKHLLYWQQAFGIKVPDSRNIVDKNSWDGPGGLGLHLVRCGAEVVRHPTFAMVDFFNVGPAIDAIDVFNGVKNPMGRKTVTSKVMPGGPGMNAFAIGTGAADTSRVSTLALVFAIVGALTLTSSCQY